MVWIRLLLLWHSFLLLYAASWDAQRVFPKLSFERPVQWVMSPQGLHYVLQQHRGDIRVFADDQTIGHHRQFLDLGHEIGVGRHISEEMGLLAMVLDSAFPQKPYAYIYYTTTPRPYKGVLKRFTVSNDGWHADQESALTILEFDQPWANHNGSSLNFGPDGMLYMSIGDGGAGGDPRNHAQNKSTLLGSVIRIDVSAATKTQPYRIPADNPFVNETGTRPEIWAYGLRNVWRMSFDPVSGTLWGGDVGQNAWEEINVIVKGGNYGWKRREGLKSFRGGKKRPGDIDPLFVYDRSATGGVSVTGGYVYRGQAFPELRGAYLFADFASGNMWLTRSKGLGYETVPFMRGQTGLSTFARDSHGELYWCRFDGHLYTLKKNNY